MQIIKLLYKYGALSSIEISKYIDKSLSHVVKHLDELLASDLVTTSGLAPSNGGRRATTFQIKEKQLYIIGVGINRFSTYLTLIDIANQEMIEETNFTYTIEKGQESIDFLCQKIKKFVASITLPKSQILGIGIAMPGFIDTKKDRNLTYEWNHIKKNIQNSTHLPTFIDNDSSCVALAVQNFGEAKDISSAMVINISWGIGLGLILDHKIYRGDKGFAGEFSHIPIFRNNMLCNCGKVGCLETETSLEYILSKINEDIQLDRPSILAGTLTGDINKDFDALNEAVHSGDFLAVESISKAAYKIGQGISILIHILNPQKIILSGQGAVYGAIWKPPIQHALNEFCIKKLVDDVEIDISKLNIYSEVLGGASLVIENIEKIPTIDQLMQLQQSLHN